jgi:hypothetical protein
MMKLHLAFVKDIVIRSQLYNANIGTYVIRTQGTIRMRFFRLNFSHFT